MDDVYGIDTLNRDSDPLDDNGHGTHTAGTLGAEGNNGIGGTGVAWNPRIVSCKALDSSGNGTDAAAIACFRRPRITRTNRVYPCSSVACVSVVRVSVARVLPWP